LRCQTTGRRERSCLITTHRHGIMRRAKLAADRARRRRRAVQTADFLQSVRRNSCARAPSVAAGCGGLLGRPRKSRARAVSCGLASACDAEAKPNDARVSVTSRAETSSRATLRPLPAPWALATRSCLDNKIWFVLQVHNSSTVRKLLINPLVLVFYCTPTSITIVTEENTKRVFCVHTGCVAIC
jgi:hypothetical protein